MTITDDPGSVATVEDEALRRLAADAGHVEAVLDDQQAPPAEAPPEDEERTPVRVAVALAFPVLAAAVMVGGIFSGGVSGRADAAIAGLLGIALALVARRLRRPLGVNLVAAVGLFVIGLLLVLPNGFNDIGNIRALVSAAAASGRVLRPPVPLDPGWQAIIGWLMGITGFATAWVAIVVRRSALALLLPLPVAAIAGISVPKDQQVGSGIAVLALFAVGLGLLASAHTVAQDEERPPLAFELRKLARSVPLVAVITVALYFLAQAHFLFPKPAIDPTQRPQRPRAIPLSQVQDRVLFEVQSTITGPWRIGGLDVYDGRDWRLPPFAQNQLRRVPVTGIVDPDLPQGVSAKFIVAGLGGAVLPALPNTVGIAATGQFQYDARNGNIRVTQGQVTAGLEYTVTAATVPTVEQLEADSLPIPNDIRQFTQIPPMPPAVTDLIGRSPKTSKWAEFDFVRHYVLDNVVASGPGEPRSITPDRVQDMLAGTREASPFEIVAAQAMLARWIGVPSRIGYGFDGGQQVGDRLQIRPRNGSTFVEVYFPGFKWLPVIGTPRVARPTVGDTGGQQRDASIQPSNDVSVQVFLPLVVPPPSTFVAQLRNIVLVVLAIALLLGLLYLLYPLVRKAWLRSRRRAAAFNAGPRARVVLAYSEWRDYAADYGYAHPTDTPLMFLNRFVVDDNHTELAWLVTRALWGDLQGDLEEPQAGGDLAAAAEELSRSLRRRLASAQPWTLQVVAALSRQSLRHRFAPDTDQPRPRRRGRGKGNEVVVAHA